MEILRNLGITRIIKAVGYSIDGLKYAFAETAFKQELIICTILFPIIFFIDVNGIEKALMFGSLFLVLIIEIINTAIETVIERISPDQHELSKKAKDLGSAAVLLSLLNVFVIWATILL